MEFIDPIPIKEYHYKKFIPAVQYENGESNIMLEEFLELTIKEKISIIISIWLTSNRSDILALLEEMDLTAENNLFLKMAVVSKSYGIVKYLLDNGVSASVDDNFAIKIAVSSIDITKLLLENGADATAEDNYPLCIATQLGRLNIMELLVQYGADIHAREEYPLRAASRRCFPSIITYLIKHGADIHVHNDFPLRIASIHSGKGIGCIKILLDTGANVKALSDQDIFEILMTGYFDGIRLLNQAGVDFTVINNYDCRSKCDKDKIEYINMLLDEIGINGKQLSYILTAKNDCTLCCHDSDSDDSEIDFFY